MHLRCIHAGEGVLPSSLPFWAAMVCSNSVVRAGARSRHSPKAGIRRYEMERPSGDRRGRTLNLRFPNCSRVSAFAESDGPQAMISKPGTYALILRSYSSAEVEIGRWGRLGVEPGYYYIYVGSAFGPGGVWARVSRHFRKTKTKHWHIDYLREFVDPVCAWYSCAPGNREHQWARTIAEVMKASAVKGFGCSDCTCYAHLFATAGKPDLVRFSRAVGGAVGSFRVPRGILT